MIEAIKKSWPTMLLTVVAWIGGALILSWQGGGEAASLKADISGVSAGVTRLEAQMARLDDVDRRVAFIEATRDTPRLNSLAAQLGAQGTELALVKVQLVDLLQLRGTVQELEKEITALREVVRGLQRTRRTKQ